MFDSTSYSYRDMAKRLKVKAKEKVFQNSLGKTTGDIELYGNFYRHAI